MLLYSNMNWTYSRPVFDSDKEGDHGYTAWRGHRHFAYDLVTAIHPKTVVELGTHYGVSFFSMSQAVKDHNYFDTELIAVDTWKGDPHASFYTDEVFESVAKVVDKHYSNLSIQLMRKTFDEAVVHFRDKSIDILHIDGFHTYDAVRHDFESWNSKVSDDGIILFHDIHAYLPGFGVHSFWNELKAQYCTLEFSHSYGLGVLFKSKEVFTKWAHMESVWQNYYGLLEGSDVANHEIESLLQENLRLVSENSRLTREIKTTQVELVGKKQSFDQFYHQLIEKDNIIQTMQDSKFWIIRGRYLRVKWALLNPLKFLRKYVRILLGADRQVQQKSVMVPKSPHILLHQGICERLTPFLDKKFPRIDRHSNKKAVLVETRILPHTEFVIKNTIQKLGKGWGHMIFCSKENIRQIRSICNDISLDIEIVVLKDEIKSGNDYNNLLLSLDFWNKITGDKVFIYQTDSFIFKSFRDEFLAWDYIGAPWQTPLCSFDDLPQMKLLGNGGLSLRSTKKIIETLQENTLLKNRTGYASEFLPEDLYFSYHLQRRGYKVPTVREALRFSFEYPIVIDGYKEIIQNSFAAHQPQASLTMRELACLIKEGFDFSGLVHIYVITWQNSKKLEYFIRFYRERFPRCTITVYDNGSTDQTHAIAGRHGCKIIPFITKGFDDIKHQEIKNNCWKGQKEEWAFCLDDDELLDITILDLIMEDADVISFTGVERFNRKNHLLNLAYNKSVAFKVVYIKEINFKVGAHAISPVSKTPLVISQKKYYLIHDKYSDKAMIGRNRVLNKRVLKENKAKNWTWHYDVNLENYYNFGVTHGVSYEQLDLAPVVDYKDFIMDMETP